jgi:hypothetical protein
MSIKEGKEVSSVWYDAVGLDISMAEFIGVHGGCQIWQSVDFTVNEVFPGLG